MASEEIIEVTPNSKLDYMLSSYGSIINVEGEELNPYDFFLGCISGSINGSTSFIVKMSSFSAVELNTKFKYKEEYSELVKKVVEPENIDSLKNEMYNNAFEFKYSELEDHFLSGEYSHIELMNSLDSDMSEKIEELKHLLAVELKNEEKSDRIRTISLDFYRMMMELDAFHTLRYKCHSWYSKHDGSDPLYSPW